MYTQINKRILAGRIITGLIVVFLFVDALMKVFKAKVSVDSTIALGYDESFVMNMGAILLISILLYVWDKTSMLGAILITGYLGGAVATHIISGVGTFVFALVFGIVLWLGYYLRDERLNAFVFWK